MWHVLSLLCMSVMFWLSSRPEGLGFPIPAPWDKLAHTAEYLVLGYLLARATGRPNLAWVIAAWFGALDEVHQAFVPGREAGLDDWWADLLGSLLGTRLGSWHHQALARRRIKSERPRAEQPQSYLPPRAP